MSSTCVQSAFRSGAPSFTGLTPVSGCCRCQHVERRPRHVLQRAETEKQIWIETQEQATFTAAIEAGSSKFLFRSESKHLADEWRGIANFDAIYCRNGQIEGYHQAGNVVRVTSKEDVKKAEDLALTPGVVIMEASDWQIIPAENLVAAFQGQPGTLFGLAKSAADARILLEALEVGTDGIVLQTNDVKEVCEAIRYIQGVSQMAKKSLGLTSATVTRVQQIGMGDRVAVDLCSLLVPGEGLLVGSFARALFLVHSECSQSQYINSRPFRVNCGPVHSYVLMPGGKTAYLSEVRTGGEILVVDPQGRQRVAIIGRAKIETRPMVLVEADIEGDNISIILQNAETVKLVCPSDSTPKESQAESRLAATSPIPVTELEVGDRLLVHLQEGARHTGIAIEETIVEK